MSRIGKKIRVLPAGVSADVSGNVLTIKGPKGELRQVLHPRVSVVIADGKISVSVAKENDKKERAVWGTFSSLIGNMIDGVTQGFQKQLEIGGVGFKAALKGEDLVLEVGYSHPVTLKPLAGVKFAVDKNIITVSGIDKQAVGEIAARVRAIKKVEPYKGKGIKYVGEVVRRKAGKTAAKAGAAAA